MIQPAHQRTGTPLIVYVSYQWGDGRALTLRETAEPLPVRQRQSLHERDGMLVGQDRTISPPRDNVRVERLGTHVEMEGVGLSIQEMIETARTLVPLPPGSPPLRESRGQSG